MKKFSDFADEQGLVGEKMPIAAVFNKTIVETGYRVIDSMAVKGKRCLPLPGRGARGRALCAAPAARVAALLRCHSSPPFARSPRPPARAGRALSFTPIRT